MSIETGAEASDEGALPDLFSETSTILGNQTPTEEVRKELVQFLEGDPSRLGEVHRGLQRGLSAEQIADELDVVTSNFVWVSDRIARSLLEGDLPTAPSVALKAARKHRNLLKREGWSAACTQYLARNISQLERLADDEAARSEEDQQTQANTEQAEASSESGIYVYALPHYLRYRYEPESGRTLMKVGHSDRDVIARFRNQTRITALPEEPILLRIYRTAPQQSASTEATFHRLLEAAEHYRSVSRSAGREWFITSARFLDEIARALSLPVRVVNHADLDAEE